MTSRSIIDLHPFLRTPCKNFLTIARDEGIGVFLTTTYRSSAEQNELHAQGRSKPGKKVTNARGGESPHNHQVDGKPASLAFDVAIRKRDGGLNWDTEHPHWKRLGEIGESLGLAWGGRWKMRDYPHFELKL